MQLKIDTFGIATDIVGTRSLRLDVAADCTVQDLRTLLFDRYAKLDELKQLAVAVNCEYVQDESMRLSEQDDIVLIPPVSGG